MFSDLGSLAFFTVLHSFLESQINRFAEAGVSRMLGFTLGISLTMATLWVMVQGYRIMTGQSRDSLMGLVIQSGKVAVILAVATAGTHYGSWVRDTINDSRDAITEIVTGSSDNVYNMVDRNLALTNTILSGITSISTVISADDKERDRAWFIGGLGSASPAIVAGTASLVNQIAIALATVLGPLFILGLLFEATKPLFWNWVRFTVAVLFSNAVLAMTSAITLKVSIAYASAVALTTFLDSKVGTGLNAASISATLMQQGGLGLVMSALLITVPALALHFFNTSIGAGVTGVTPFGSSYGNGKANPLSGQVAGVRGEQSAKESDNGYTSQAARSTAPRNTAAGHTSDTMGPGLHGNAGRTPSTTAQLFPFLQTIDANRARDQQQNSNPPTA